MAELTDTYAGSATRPRSSLRRWPLFVAIGIVLYAALYAWAESLVHARADHNRFFQIATAPAAVHDHIILGASHALPFDYGDMNERLEEASGKSIMNLANEGAGVLPNQLMLDYFLAKGHRARNVVFFLDSFAFYSRQWNEDRLDTAMLQRAPFDPALIATLWQHEWARDEILPYASGFFKINNQDRFAPDLTEAELTKFDRTYRPIPQIDRERIAYLYPEEIPQDLFAQYMTALERMIDTVEAQGGTFTAIKPPTPPRYREALPNEAAFDDAVADLVARRGIAYHDFSRALPDDANYYDTDHLNQTGITNFIEEFANILR